MKTVINEWMTNKKASTIFLLVIAVGSISYITNPQIIINISNLLSNTDGDICRYIRVVIKLIIVNVCSSFMTNYLMKLMVYQMYTFEISKYNNKILDADYDMFTKLSCAKIYTVSEFVTSISSLGKYTAAFILSFINLFITITSMYIMGKSIILPVIIIYAIGMIINRNLYTQSRKLDRRGGEIKKIRNQEIENIVNGFAEVREFGMVENHRTLLNHLSNEIFKIYNIKCMKQCASNSILDVIEWIGIIYIVWMSLNQINSGNLTPADAMSLIMFSFRLFGPILTIMNYLENLSSELSLEQDFSELMSYTNKNKLGTITMDKLDDSIEFNNVSFAYDKSSSILNGISLEIHKGQRIGICGLSGAGKSTIMNLLNKFYDVSSGSISIDGVNISDITNSSYRKYVGCVNQENYIFPGTIKENIKYGSDKGTYTENDFINACKKANIYEFIKSLDDGFDTDVGPRGLKLSGGQKQRIALARIFLKDPDIILLDEATSALDNENEKIIQDAINNVKNKTIIAIAHRLTTIKDSDIIYVIDSKGISEKGSHNDLMELRGKYYKMYMRGESNE